jgi:hypothetical protein
MAEKRQRWKQFFASLLVLGLAWEFIEAASVDREVADIQSTNLVLRAKIVGLEQKLQPRRITMEQRDKFKFLTERITKIPIIIGVSVATRETVTFACDLRELLGAAGFKTNSDAHPWGINFEPDKFTAEDFGKPEPPVDISFWGNYIAPGHGFTNILGILALSGQTEKTNGFIRPIVSGTNEIDIYSALAPCFEQIGIKSKIGTNWGPLTTNERLILVEPKQ